ncbi:zinc finger CCHC domain-containing protein 9 [Paragonimus westermani]|uniref:Zinc finger CCHC domain-containing protein 9 n=1 Tax=Paragonimus westermani TaxID=34504 RepID=A0A5J4NQF7_9TREM|nr:zinc finger CCHC domain-containing protein 9 [Paragonimus westermani]
MKNRSFRYEGGLLTTPEYRGTQITHSAHNTCSNVSKRTHRRAGGDQRHHKNGCVHTVTNEDSICLHCGSTDHTVNQCSSPDQNFAFAHCLKCSQFGHMAVQCPSHPNRSRTNTDACFLCNGCDHQQYTCPLREVGDEPRVGSKKITLDICANPFTMSMDEDNFGLPKEKSAPHKRKPRVFKLV